MGIKAVGSQFDQNQNFPPDAEIIFREWCVNTTAITDICSTRVATRLARSADLPFLTIFNAGGTLMQPNSEAAITGAAITVDAYAGRWGSGGTTSQPDYANAYALANAVAASAFKMKSTRVKTPTTNTSAVIYNMEVQGLPTRIEETETGLGHYQLSLIMYYRGLD